MTATQALNHSYLADFHSEDDEPVCTQAVDFSFEKLSPSELQGNIHIRTDTRKIIYYYFTELSNDIFLFVTVLMWEISRFREEVRSKDQIQITERHEFNDYGGRYKRRHVGGDNVDEYLNKRMRNMAI